MLCSSPAHCIYDGTMMLVHGGEDEGSYTPEDGDGGDQALSDVLKHCF